MPQKEIDTGSYEIKGLKKAAAKAYDITVHKSRYRVYYSIITHNVHIVGPSEEPDPDWLLCEDKTPYSMGQQALADCIVAKLDSFMKNITMTGGLQKYIDELTNK